jgi:hypothetical protein
MVAKIQTMKFRGGNADIYRGDGRLAMAHELERRWPGIVSIDRRWGRPQHVVDWKLFRGIPLVRREGVELGEGPGEYGVVLRRVRDRGEKA